MSCYSNSCCQKLISVGLILSLRLSLSICNGFVVPAFVVGSHISRLYTATTPTRPTRPTTINNNDRTILTAKQQRNAAITRICTCLKLSLNGEQNADEAGLNELQTLLREAVLAQDFEQAGLLSNKLYTILYGTNDDDQDPEVKRAKRRRMSWRGLGAAPWLVDRLDALNYTLPTTIQINAMEAVNAILNTTSTELSLEERVEIFDQDDMGIVISGSTGSGKTLAYLVPLLSTLTDSLFTRQRIRVGAEEQVGDATGNLVDRLAVVTSPVVRTTARRPIRTGSAITTGASIATLGSSGKDVKTPLALIVVPTRELGVQIALLLYELVGGSVKRNPTELRGKANMFKYKGPKGVKVACVLDDEEAEFGLKLQTDVAITTPKYLHKLIQDGDVDPSKLRVIIYDEADLALEETNADDLSQIFDIDDQEFSRMTFLVGASVTESLGSLAVSSRLLPQSRSYIATATRFAPLQDDYYNSVTAASSNNNQGYGDNSDESTSSSSSNINSRFFPRSSIVGEENRVASLKDLNVCLDPGLRHERVTVPKNSNKLLALIRLLRQELRKYEKHESGISPRVVVFFASEEQAKASIEVLRDALWGEHKLCVLLPTIGINPLTFMEQFKESKTSVMLATPNSVRGLDFPALTHVYTLYLPDPREYVHLAGRVGRIGQMGSTQGQGGRVISILDTQDSVEMQSLATQLGFSFFDTEVPQDRTLIRLDDPQEEIDDTKLDSMRRYLEDTITLVDLAEDPEIDLEKVEEQRRNAPVDYGDDDDDDDDE